MVPMNGLTTLTLGTSKKEYGLESWSRDFPAHQFTEP